MLSGRVKRIGLSVLVVLALGLTILFAVQTVRAIHHFQQSHQLALSGDVRSIRPWMTVPYIARVYHVPESYLLQTLDVSDPESVRHVTLYSLAPRLRLTTDALIQKLQTAILTYRQSHPTPSPTPPQSGNRLNMAFLSGRTRPT